MSEVKRKLTMYPATYEIKVPGYLDAGWLDWADALTITAEDDEDGRAVTTLTGKIDQAALLGLLRRLYGLGLPLISVTWIAEKQPVAKR